LSSDELPWGAHLKPRMWMVLVIVLKPSGDLPECGDRIRKRFDANIVSLERFDEALGMPFDSGL
jgi:hypothetical protein